MLRLKITAEKGAECRMLRLRQINIDNRQFFFRASAFQNLPIRRNNLTFPAEMFRIASIHFRTGPVAADDKNLILSGSDRQNTRSHLSAKTGGITENLTLLLLEQRSELRKPAVKTTHHTNPHPARQLRRNNFRTRMKKNVFHIPADVFSAEFQSPLPHELQPQCYIMFHFPVLEMFP